MNNIEYIVIKEAKVDHLLRLYKEAGWWSDKDDENYGILEEIVKKTFCFVGAFESGVMIGMGRAISDGVSDAYIQDVTVLKSYRKKGIGGNIINELVKHLQSKNINWIGLIGEPGTKSFYNRLNFCEMKDYIPMIFKREKNG